MRRFRLAPLWLLLSVAACASHASPEDRQMGNAMCDQGKVLLAQGKKDEARDIYASAAQRDGDNPRAWNGLGVALDLLGKHREAEDAYQQALDLAPNDLTALNNLAHLYLVSGRAAEAVRLLEPHANDPAASAALQQNLTAARAAAGDSEAQADGNYADLGSYPTEGMARAHATEAQKLLDDRDVRVDVVPEVKVGGGTPVFTIKATGKAPQDVCDRLNGQAFPCVPNGK